MKLECIALSREARGGTQWLITNGENMGKWTYFFGADCLEDLYNDQKLVENMAKQTEYSTLHKFCVEELT